MYRTQCETKRTRSPRRRSLRRHRFRVAARARETQQAAAARIGMRHSLQLIGTGASRHLVETQIRAFCDAMRGRYGRYVECDGFSFYRIRVSSLTQASRRGTAAGIHSTGVESVGGPISSTAKSPPQRPPVAKNSSIRLPDSLPFLQGSLPP